MDVHVLSRLQRSFGGIDCATSGSTASVPSTAVAGGLPTCDVRPLHVRRRASSVRHFFASPHPPTSHVARWRARKHVPRRSGQCTARRNLLYTRIHAAVRTQPRRHEEAPWDSRGTLKAEERVRRADHASDNVPLARPLYARRRGWGAQPARTARRCAGDMPTYERIPLRHRSRSGGPAAAIRNGAQFLGDPDCLVAALAFSGRAMTNAVRHRARRYSAPHENFGKSSLTGCARISMGIDSLVLAWDRSVARVCARGCAGRPLSKRVQSSLFISRSRSLLPLLDFPNAANASSQGPNAISMPLRAEPHFHLRKNASDSVETPEISRCQAAVPLPHQMRRTQDVLPLPHTGKYAKQLRHPCQPHGREGQLPCAPSVLAAFVGSRSEPARGTPATERPFISRGLGRPSRSLRPLGEKGRRRQRWARRAGRTKRCAP